MCGFIGACSANYVESNRLFGASRLLAHRGPDDEAFCVFPNFAAGFRRLKILDLTDAARQPMSDRTGRFWLVFNGEIYNYRELRQELSAHGVVFRTQGDSEVLLEAYLRWGHDSLNRLNGMFAFAIWDTQKQELFCARDRFGEKPFYYAQRTDTFYFASEIKALFAFSDVDSTPNWQTIRRYICSGVIDVPPDTCFENVFVLPPAHWLVVSNGIVTMGEYWTLPLGNECVSDPVTRFRELFFESLRLRTRSDVPVGTCLSGGLDSGAIVCGLSELDGHLGNQLTHKTFTAAYAEYDETEEVRSVNESSGSLGHYCTPIPKDWDEIRRLLWFHDEPFHSVTAYASFAVMELARRNNVVVLLNGQGADELLAGYQGTFPYYLLHLLTHGQWLAMARAAMGADEFTGRSSAKLLVDALRLGVSEHLGGIRLLRERARKRKWMHATQQCCLTDDFVAATNNDQSTPVDEVQHSLFRRLQRRMAQHTPLPLYLRIEDRNSMAHSMESRLPFLDHRLAELAVSINVKQLMCNGWNKWILREAMSGILPDRVRLRRQKFGFPVPECDWVFRQRVAETRGILYSNDCESLGVFNTAALNTRFEQDSKHPSDASAAFFFRCASVALWMRRIAEFKEYHEVDELPPPTTIVNTGVAIA